MFATADDVAIAMKRTFTQEERAWVETLLAQSAAAIRDVIGQHVFPQQVSTFTAWPIGGSVTLPQGYVVSVDAVTRDGVPVDFDRFEDTVLVAGSAPVEVTFTYGLAEPPTTLVGLNTVMVSSAITLVESDLGLSVGGLSSVALDDFKIAFADGGDKTGHLVLPDIQSRMIREAYGRTGWTVDFR